MALVAEDLNVFGLPHNHMKRLVGEIEKQVLATNFSDEESYHNLLDTLNNGFNTLLSHEAIEDHYIIHPLLPRLPSTVKVTLENDVHSDNRLAQLHGKVKKQLDMDIVSPSERVHFGEQLQEELFSLKLIPHMDEEEEVFQPLLLQYFSQQELRSIKQTVIKLHNLPECIQSEILAPILQLPPEIILKVFKYLSPRDLCRCAQVHSLFSKVAYDGSLWRHLHPVEWLTGRWKFRSLPTYDKKSLEDLANDGCGGELEITNQSSISQLLYDFVCNLLPKVGVHVLSLSLAHAGRMEIKYLYQALSLCPNLVSLDLSYTSTSDFAFTGLIRNHSASKLQYLNLSGCSWISDLTLERLAKAFKPSMKHNGITTAIKMSENNKCVTSNNNCTCSCKNKYQDSLCEKPRLRCLRLSGCHLITDKGLRAMASVGVFSHLKFLDFSGVDKITAGGLETFLQMCPNIRPDLLFYCDNIVNGPYAAVANGCQNVDSSKICCRNFNYVQ